MQRDRKIKHSGEGIDFVTCRICGEDFRTLPSHLKSRHNMTSDEYKKEFGVGYLCCKETRQLLSDTIRKGEKETVYEPLFRHEIDEKLRELSKTTSPLSYQILCNMGHADLAHQARVVYGNVDNALEALNLAVLERNFWTPEKVVRALRDMHAAGLPLNHSSLAKNAPKLEGAVTTHFGKLSKALQSAGFDPADHLARCVLTEEEWEDAFRQWVAEHGPLSCKALRETGFNSLYQKAAKTYGSISAAAVSMGLPYEQFRRPLTREEVITELRKRVAKGQPIGFSALHRNNSRLYNAMVRHWGSHKQCLADLNYDMAQVIAKKWTRSRIERSLRAFAAKHGVVNGLEIFRRKRELHRATVNEFGSIKAAAETLGLEFAGRKPTGQRPPSAAE